MHAVRSTASAVEQAGAVATKERDPIRDRVPARAHQRVDVVLGPAYEVERAVARRREAG